MNYDSWKTMSPEDENPCCEHCGVSARIAARGWMPDCCTGECGRCWRDPDAEYEAQRDEQ